MEICFKITVHDKKNHHFKDLYDKTIQLAIIQAFTDLGEIKFEQMVVILNVSQKMKNNKNIHYKCIKSILFNHD